jgi:hypothetical protein
MEEKLILTPEQLYFLGAVMEAESINYDYIAAMGEVQRNYSRAQRKSMDDLARAGLLRMRLGGEAVLRPAVEKLLHPVFFGRKESSLEIFRLGKEKIHDIFRFHWSQSAVTQVQQTKDRLILNACGPEQLEALVAEQVCGTERPMRLEQLFEENVTRILAAKRATVGEGSTGVVLFEVFGGLYSMDENEKLHAIPASQARAMILAELKGE